MFERKNQKVASLRAFVKRMALHAGIAVLLVLVALFIGVAGYHYAGGLGWTDALLNASMILSGMGPVDRLVSPVAKVFASLYALFSGLVFIAVMGIILSPVVHRMLHKFHVD